MEGLLLIRDLAVVLVVAGTVAWAARRTGLSIIVGYLVAGMIIGPHTPPFALVADLERVHTLAQLGLVFLVFSIGLNLSLSRLKSLGLPVVLATLVAALIILNGGRSFGHLLGWQGNASLFLAAMLMVSSSAIISKVLAETGQTHDRAGQLALGVTVLEDVVAVTMLTLLTSLVLLGGAQPPPLLPTLGELAGFVVLLAVLSLTVMPRLLARLVGPPEIRTLLVGGLLLSLAWLAAHLGYSLALGAFVFGAIIGSTRFKGEVERAFEGLDQIFGAVFFVAVGMMVDLRLLAEAWPLMIAIAAVALILRPAACCIGLLAAGNRTRDAVQAGLSLAPLGEFSFIIAQLGVDTKLLAPSVYPAAVGASLVTSLVAPLMTRRAEFLGRLAERKEPAVLKRWTTLRQQAFAALGSRGSASRLWHLASRPITQVLLHGVLVSVLLAFAQPIATALQGWLGDRGPAPATFPVLFWSVAALVLLGPLIALWRGVAALSVILSETITTGTGHVSRLRPLVDALLRGTALVILVGWLLALRPTDLPPGSAIVLAVIVVTVAAVFWRRFLRLHTRFETGLIESFHEAVHPVGASSWSSLLPHQTLDWRLDLEEIALPGDSAHAGRTLGELALRSTTGCSVVGVDRQGFAITNPRADLVLYPRDKLLLLGRSRHLAEAAAELRATASSPEPSADFNDLVMDTLTVPLGCPLAGRSLSDLDLIRQAGIQIGGIRHGRHRRLSPAGDDSFAEGDELLVLGTQARILDFAAMLAAGERKHTTPSAASEPSA